MASSENAFLFIGSTQIKFTPMGAPGAPANLTLDTLTLSWSAGDVGSAGPTLGYGVEVEPRGPVVTVNSSDPTVGGTATLENVQTDVQYTFKVYGVNQAGRGEAATLTKTFIYNIATGGSVKDVSNYNGTGQTWRVHTFTGNGTFNVEVATKPFRVLVVASGGWSSAGGGGAGGLLQDDDISLAAQAHTITVGPVATSGQSGKDSAAFGMTAIGGGHGGAGEGKAGVAGGSGGGGGGATGKYELGSVGKGGAGTDGQGHKGGYGRYDNGGNYGSGGGGGAGGIGQSAPQPTYGGQGGAGIQSDITGVVTWYAGGGNGRGLGKPPTPEWAGCYGGGNGYKTPAGSGIVIVAYQIG